MLAALFAGALAALLTALPLAWKWQLGLGRSATVVSAVALAAALVVVGIAEVVAVPRAAGAAVVWLSTLAVVAALVGYRFYRDPERTPPPRDDVVVSPADGRVVYIRRSHGGVLPVATKNGRAYRLDELTKTRLSTDDAFVIGIALNFLDVHVNRAPIAGEVTQHRHSPGLFGSLRRPEMVFENERATIVIERGDLQLAVVLIASRLVRRIVAFVRESQPLVLGQRIGAIRFGSQVDVVLPARDGIAIVVHPGDRVTAGESIIAVLEADCR